MANQLKAKGKQTECDASSEIGHNKNTYTFIFLSIMCLAFGGTIGMSFLILACALKQYAIWWPFFVVVFYLLALLPRLLVRGTNAPLPAIKDASTFFAVGMILSSFALPIVLARASVIKVGASYLTVGANFVNFFTIAMYLKLTEAEEAYMGNF